MSKTKLLYLLLCVFSISHAQIPTANLVGHYDFSQGALTDNINNVSFTKTGTASTTITDRFGNADEAMSLNGDDLTRPDIEFDVTNANPFLPKSISFWIKTGTNDGNLRYLYNDNDQTSLGDTNFLGLTVVFQNGTIKAINRVGTNGNVFTHPTFVADNVWHHVVVQAHSDELTGLTKAFSTFIFVDGVKIGGSGYNGTSSTLSVRENKHIGNVSFSRLKTISLAANSKYQDGIDEVLFYTRLLTDAEVNAITTNTPCTANVNIPDANFKAALVVNTAINTDGDAEISCAEATAFTGGINVSNQSIVDLIGIEAFTNIIELNIQNNSVNSLDLSNNTALIGLYCNNNQLSSLDVSTLSNLLVLRFRQNNITAIDISSLSNLEQFDGASNQLTSLDFTNNPDIEWISAFSNNLTSINIANRQNLTLLFLDNNPLTALDVTTATSLNAIALSGTQLTTVDLSNNTLLTEFTGNNASFTSLDFSNNPQLFLFSVAVNNLTNLNMANGNNAGLGTNFNATGNPNLSCIQIDAGFTPPTGWQKDTTASYSDDCSNLSINDFNLETVSLYPNPSTTVLNIKMKTNLKQATIYSILGAEVLKTTSKVIHTSTLNRGMYLIKIEDKSGTVSTKRFLKQ